MSRKTSSLLDTEDNVLDIEDIEDAVFGIEDDVVLVLGNIEDLVLDVEDVVLGVEDLVSTSSSRPTATSSLLGIEADDVVLVLDDIEDLVEYVVLGVEERGRRPRCCQERGPRHLVLDVEGPMSRTSSGSRTLFAILPASRPGPRLRCEEPRPRCRNLADKVLEPDEVLDVEDEDEDLVPDVVDPMSRTSSSSRTLYARLPYAKYPHLLVE